MSTDLRRLLDDAPMRRFQWFAVGLCVMLNVLDGFDVLVMAFTGRSVVAEWDLSAAALGLLLSAGLVGMAVGSLCLAPLADRVGRRPMILVCLTISGAGMILSSISQSAVQLGVLRVLTGVGIGGVLAFSNTIAAEYASRRWRGLAVSLQATGYAIGATLGGVLAVVLIGAFGWRSVFLVGGLATLVMIVPVAVVLPESLGFLTTRRPTGALTKVNAVLRRLGHPSIAALPEAVAAPRSLAGGFRALLAPGVRRATLTLWASFFLVMAGFYFVTSWTPTLLVEAGLSGNQGLTGGTLLNLGGIFGPAALGLLAARWALRGVLAGYLLAAGVLLVLLPLSLSSIAMAFALGLLIGVVVNGCIAGLYALAATDYDDGVRATGVGTAIGTGRVGAIMAPTVAGSLLDVGWTPQNLYVAFGAIFALTALLPMLTRTRPVPEATRVSGPAPQADSV